MKVGIKFRKVKKFGIGWCILHRMAADNAKGGSVRTPPPIWYRVKENPNIRKIFFLHFQVRRLMVMIRGLSLNKEKSSKEQEIIVGNVASGWVPVRNPKSKVYIF